MDDDYNTGMNSGVIMSVRYNLTTHILLTTVLGFLCCSWYKFMSDD